MCSLPGECGILSQAAYPVLDKGKVLEALVIARDEEKLKVDILNLMSSTDTEFLVVCLFVVSDISMMVIPLF